VDVVFSSPTVGLAMLGDLPERAGVHRAGERRAVRLGTSSEPANETRGHSSLDAMTMPTTSEITAI
jgi:hypothetical protein